MESKGKSKKLIIKIILISISILFIIAFLYCDHINSIWDSYEAIESFSENRKHFDKIVEIVLEHWEKTKCDYYTVGISGIYGVYRDQQVDSIEIDLSEKDMYALNKVKETLAYNLHTIYIKDYGVDFVRDEKTCHFIYIYKDIDVNDINTNFIKDSSDYLVFKKIEDNWYNVLRKSYL